MTSTNHAASTKVGGLVCPSLINMASKGFDTRCLLNIQQSAFRAAAQQVHQDHAGGATVKAKDLVAYVNRHLAGDNFKGNSEDVTPKHIATYMQTMAFMQQGSPRHLLREAEALAAIKLPEDTYGNDVQQLIIHWLARHIVDLKRYAAACETATANFSKTLRDGVAQIVRKYPQSAELKSAIAEIENEALADRSTNDETGPSEGVR